MKSLGWSLRRLARAGLLGLGALLALALGLLLIAATWNALCNARDRRRFQPPGKLYEVAGHKLHLHCTGQGQPTVVLDTGFGMPALGWVRVQTELARHHRVCSYDRAGLGYSEPEPTLTPRPAARLAAELQLLLQRAQEPGPYVLVGHSNGGYLIRAYYERFPAEIAAAVLVDSSSEYMDERFMATLGRDWRAEAAAELRQAQRLQPVIRLLIWSGVLRWQLGQAAKQQDFNLGPQVVAEAIYLLNRPTWYPASVAELAGVTPTCDAMRAGKGLGSLPLIVLTAEDFTPNGGPEHMKQQWNRLWVHELQPQLARLSTRGRQVLAKSGHMIPFEAPEAVVSAVAEVLAMRAAAP